MDASHRPLYWCYTVEISLLRCCRDNSFEYIYYIGLMHAISNKGTAFLWFLFHFCIWWAADANRRFTEERRRADFCDSKLSPGREIIVSAENGGKWFFQRRNFFLWTPCVPALTFGFDFRPFASLKPAIRSGVASYTNSFHFPSNALPTDFASLDSSSLVRRHFERDTFSIMKRQCKTIW